MKTAPAQVPSMIGTLVVVLAIAAIAFMAYRFEGNEDRSIAPNISQEYDGAGSEVRTAIGTVVGISGKEISLEHVKKIPMTPETPDTMSMSAVVTADASTVIERLVPKSPSVLEKERAAFAKEAQSAGAAAALIPPEPFTRTKIALADINVGDMLVVFANGDITKSSAFTAARIDVQYKSGVVESTPSTGNTAP